MQLGDLKSEKKHWFWHESEDRHRYELDPRLGAALRSIWGFISTLVNSWQWNSGRFHHRGLVALANGYVIFTHDLDFGAILALTHASGPSVVQIRSRDVLPESIGTVVLATLQQNEQELLAGALVVVDPKKYRVRVLPLF